MIKLTEAVIDLENLAQNLKDPNVLYKFRKSIKEISAKHLKIYIAKINKWFEQVNFIQEENKIDLLWDELKIFLEDDEDFRILNIQDDYIKIKALNPMAFRKESVYCKILSNITPTNCNLELSSIYDQRDRPEKDSLIFNFSISAENNLHYKGRIKIIK